MSDRYFLGGGGYWNNVNALKACFLALPYYPYCVHSRERRNYIALTVFSQTLRKLCAKNNASLAATDPRKDRDAMRLRPGEVGLRGDRATFHLGGGPLANAKAAKDGRPPAAIYYNVQPEAVADSAIAQDGYMQRRYVKQMLPPLPATTEPLVGPVTGLPVDKYKEDIYVLRLGKQHGEPDDMAPLQIEMRVPKDQDEKPKDVGTQFVKQDYLSSAPVVPIEPKPAKSKKKEKKAGDAKKGKKATKKK